SIFSFVFFKRLASTSLEQQAGHIPFSTVFSLSFWRISFDRTLCLLYTLCFVRGIFPLVVGHLAHGGMVGWEGILRSRNRFDGMGRKSGRNGAPAPKSRVSLSDSEPRA